MLKHTSINQLVVRLELGFLAFVLAVLLVSALDPDYHMTAPPGGGEVPVRTAEHHNRLKENSGREEALPQVRTFIVRERESWTGDLDEMFRREKIRVLFPVSRMSFTVESGHRYGLTYDLLKRYEKFLNDIILVGNGKVELVFLPTPEERLLDDLLAGVGDIAADDLTVTSARKKTVDFAAPLRSDIQEILVTGTDAPPVKSIFNLSGKEVVVRKDSEYHESLLELNGTLESLGKEPVHLRIADKFLRDEDLLEMIDAGLLPMTIMNSHAGEFWSGILENLQLHRPVRLRTAKEIAWAVRPETPLLKESINYFIKSTRLNGLNNDRLYEYYRKKEGRIRNNLRTDAVERFNSTVRLFKKYGDQYRFPYLLLAAFAYQVSELDQSRRGADGAAGIMQVPPSVAAEMKISRLDILENNIHAGTKYLRFLADRYFFDPDLSEFDRILMTVAAYKVGPEKVMEIRDDAAQIGLDPDIWFDHVETAASMGDSNGLARFVRNVYIYLNTYGYLPEKGKQREKPFDIGQ